MLQGITIYNISQEVEKTRYLSISRKLHLEGKSNFNDMLTFKIRTLPKLG